MSGSASWPRSAALRPTASELYHHSSPPECRHAHGRDLQQQGGVLGQLRAAGHTRGAPRDVRLCWEWPHRPDAGHKGCHLRVSARQEHGGGHAVCNDAGRAVDCCDRGVCYTAGATRNSENTKHG